MILSEPFLLAIRLVQAVLDNGWYERPESWSRPKFVQFTSTLIEDTSCRFDVGGQLECAPIHGCIHLRRERLDQQWEAYGSIKLGSSRYAVELKSEGRDVSVAVYAWGLLTEEKNPVSVVRLIQLEKGKRN